MYPLKIKSNAKFIEELQGCEYGRYEDATIAREANDLDSIEANDYQVVACDFLGRYKTQIEVQSNEELEELYYALASGTIGLFYCKHANKLLDEIREQVRSFAPEVVKLYPIQNGH